MGANNHETNQKRSPQEFGTKNSANFQANRNDFSRSNYWTCRIHAKRKNVFHNWRRWLDHTIKDWFLWYIDKETKEVDDRRRVGVIAQELNEVLPEAVTYAEDVDEYGVDYGKLTGVLIEAIKELKQEINELKGS